MNALERGALGLRGYLDGVDVSAIQGDVDWNAVASAGFRFAIVKASEGIGYTDPRAIENLEGARAAGLVVGAYHFARVSHADPGRQVQRLWRSVGRTMPDMPPILDLEAAPSSMTAAEIVAFGNAWVEEAKGYFGRAPVLYSYPSFLFERMGPALEGSRLAECPLWIAQYRSTSAPWAPTSSACPGVPSPWSRWALWQYSGDGGYRVPGVSVDCDRNLFCGDESAFQRFLGRPAVDSKPGATVFRGQP